MPPAPSRGCIAACARSASIQCAHPRLPFRFVAPPTCGQAELSVLAASAALASANSTEYKLHLGQARAHGACLIALSCPPQKTRCFNISLPKALKTPPWVVRFRHTASRLAQRVQHKVHGYVGIVCGMDRVCYETPEWLAKAYGKGGAEALPSGRGTDQPFYLVLPDVRAIATVAVNYVAEDMLEPAPKASGSEPRRAVLCCDLFSERGSALISLLEAGVRLCVEDATAAARPLVVTFLCVPCPSLSFTCPQGAQDSPLEHPYTYIMFLGPDAQARSSKDISDIYLLLCRFCNRLRGLGVSVCESEVGEGWSLWCSSREGTCRRSSCGRSTTRRGGTCTRSTMRRGRRAARGARRAATRAQSE